MALTIELYTLDNVTPSGTTELSIVFNATYAAGTNKTDDGIFQLFLDDQGNMTKTEEYEIRVMEKVHNGGTQKNIFKARLKGTQSEPFVTPPLALGNGWDFTIKKIAGTDRAFDARITQLV